MGTKKTARRKSSVIGNVSLLLLSVIFALVIGEIGLRLFNYSAPIFRKIDADLGWILYPGIEGWHRKENMNYLRINSQGRNDGIDQQTKSPHTIRIAILGDSFTESAEVPRDKNFVSLLEANLNDFLHPYDKNVQILNFGVVGYGTAQQLLMLRKRVWHYNPDVIVLAVYIGNDISDNHLSLAESLKEIRPYFKISNGKLIRDGSHPDPNSLNKDQIIIELINHSRILQLLKEVSLRPISWGDNADTTVPIQDSKIENEVFLKPQTREWIEAWDVTENLILEMQHDVNNRNKKFLMLIIPEPIQVHPLPEIRRAFTKELGVENLFYPEHRLITLAKSNSIPNLALSAGLRRYSESNTAYLHGFNASNLGNGHWNELGHKVSSQLITTSLKPLVEHLVNHPSDKYHTQIN